MSKIQIMTDSASDISVADEKNYNISIIPFPIVIGDKSYVSRVDFDNEQFYKMLSEHDEIPKTSQINVFEFVDIYLNQAKSGVTDLVVVLINSHGSSTYENSVRAVEMFYQQYPQYKDTFHVHSFDGIGYNALYGAPVVHAAQMVANGAELDEVLTYLKETLPKRQIFFGIYNLKYAAKSGRIPTAAAFLGNTLNLKPVMKIFGKSITTAAKCLGERKLVEKVVELTLENMEPNTPYQLIYGNDSTCLDDLRRLMESKLGYGPEAAYQIGAAVAVNSGPKVAGIAFTIKQDK